MTKKRVVVTGMGVVSCFGQDVNNFYNALLAGKSGVKTISLFNADDFPTRIACEVQDFSTDGYVDKKQARRIDREIAFAIVSGKKALEHAGLFPSGFESLDQTRCGSIIGSGIGGMKTFEDNVQILHEKGLKRVTPFLIPFILTNMGSALLAMDVGFMGPNYSISTACATANNCIVAAAEHIRKGEADLMVCGGAEAPLSPIGLGGFCAVKALSERNDAPEKASRPFDKSRDGFVMAEGAGCLVLESLEHAQKRGATILCEYLGGALSCDAHHMTDPRTDGKGVQLCIEKALLDAGITADDVDLINGHATSTPAGDLCEVGGCLNVFKNPEKIHLQATKSMIGHSLGAAGALEAVAVIEAIRRKEIHPSINIEDPEDIPFKISSQKVDDNVRIGISNSFGFGGHNATVVFGEYS